MRRPDRFVLPVVLGLLLPACAPKTAVQSAGTDQEITRAILWEYRQNPGLADVLVSCVEHRLTLEGRVPDRAAHETAVRIAARHARGAPIDDRIAVKPR